MAGEPSRRAGTDFVRETSRKEMASAVEREVAVFPHGLVDPDEFQGSLEASFNCYFRDGDTLLDVEDDILFWPEAPQLEGEDTELFEYGK
jgi:hypothetical protein